MVVQFDVVPVMGRWHHMEVACVDHICDKEPASNSRIQVSRISTHFIPKDRNAGTTAHFYVLFTSQNKSNIKILTE